MTLVTVIPPFLSVIIFWFSPTRVADRALRAVRRNVSFEVDRVAVAALRGMFDTLDHVSSRVLWLSAEVVNRSYEFTIGYENC